MAVDDLEQLKRIHRDLWIAREEYARAIEWRRTHADEDTAPLEAGCFVPVTTAAWLERTLRDLMHRIIEANQADLYTGVSTEAANHWLERIA